MQKEQVFSNLNMELLHCDYLHLKEWFGRNNVWPWWRIYWNEAPGAVVTFREQRYDVLPDSLLVVPPNTIINRDLEQPVNHFYIHVKTPQIQMDIKPHIARLELDEILLNVIKNIAQKIAKRRPVETYSFNETSTILSIVYYVLSQINPAFYVEKVSDSRIRKILLYLDQHFTEKIKNDQLAEKINMSRNSFLRLFKEQTGTTPGSYILNKRLDLAAEQLLASTNSIDEVADICGFVNRYYFSRMFKKYRNLSPALYRRYNRAF